MCVLGVSQENGPMMKSSKRWDNQEKLKVMGKRQICLKCTHFKRILRNGCITFMARREKDKYITMFTVTSMTAKSRNKLLHPPSRDLLCEYDVQSYWEAPHQSPSPMLTDIYASWSGKALQASSKMSIKWSNLCKSVHTASHLQHVCRDAQKNTHRCGRWLSLEEETGVMFEDFLW